MLSLARAVALAAVLALIVATTAGASHRAPTSTPDFGPNVKIIDPSMTTAQIKAIVDPIAAQQVPNEFGTQRYAILFKPGAYGTSTPLNFNVGYYTDIAGLGARPGDVAITGTIDVRNQCNSGGCFALTNFWRSLSNLTLHINTGSKTGCDAVGEFWATSQAAPMRRVQMDSGLTTLMDFCTPPSFASGGFIADSVLPGTVVNGSQQQWLTRNSTVGVWTNGVWNQVFAGVNGAPAQHFPGDALGGPYTTLPTNPVSREKPFLYLDASGSYNVYVPDRQVESAGPTWTTSQTPGHSLPIDRFFIAKPSDDTQSINNALSRGQNLIFTPGVYDVDQTIKVKRADTIVLGLGMATLTAQNGVVPMTVADVAGVEISGLIFDAGPVESPVLLQVGDRHPEGNSDAPRADASDPVALHDVFFRIGGPHVGKAATALAVGRDDTILDDIWAWRADHGNGVGWTSNTSDTGVEVTGDNVTATGLFVEHFQKYNVYWAGENGKTIMFQNEMPYDPPNQAAYQHDGLLGWAAYKVADSVKTHEGWGLGSYCFFNVDPTIHNSHAFEVPVTPGVRLHDLLDISISGNGTIDHVINDTGAANGNPATVPVNVVSYP
jgi:hypothetical protein